MKDLTNRTQARPPSQSDMAAVVAEIAVTLATMPRQATAAADAEDIVRIYASDLLSEFTAPEIVGALKDFRLGRCGGKFAPTIGEIAKHIREQPPAIPKTYRIDRDSKWGRAWDYYARREGVKIMWIGGSTGLMRSLWPPGCDEQVAEKWEREWSERRVSAETAEQIQQIINGSFRSAAE